MNRMVMSLVLVCWACIAVLCLGVARGDDSAAAAPASRPAKPGILDRLPEAVRKTALKEVGDHKVHGIEKETRDGKPCYAIEWMADGKEVEVWIAEDGTLVAREVHEVVPQPRPKSRKELRDDMKKVLELTDEQVRRIAALDETLDKDAAKWQADNGAKVQQAQRAMFTSRDAAALLKAVQKLQELKKPYAEMLAKAAADVQAVLSDAQQAKWQEHAVIDLSMGVWFARAKLTDAQQTAVRTAYAELAKAKDATVQTIQVGLAEKVRNLLSDEQLKALAPFLMQTEWSFHIPASGPATMEKGPEARSTTSVDGGLLMLPAPKLLKNGVLALAGGYGGITGPQAGGGNTIVSPESED